MRRLVVCRDNEGNILDEASCESSDKPDAIQNCRGETCGKWYQGEWSLVSSLQLAGNFIFFILFEIDLIFYLKV